MIENNDISVVVQGPVLGDPWALTPRRWTARTLRTLRHLLPGTTLILSTWTGTNVTGLDYDLLVTSPDPGPQPLRKQGERVMAWNNVNRQIVSTQAGLAAVTTPFVMKVRSDLILRNTRFLESFDRWTKPDPEWTFVKSRIIGPAYLARLGPDEGRFKPLLFHPNDWFYFGRTDDVRGLFDIPLQPDEDARWFETRPKPVGVTDRLGDVSRWPAETYLWCTFLKKHRAFNFDSYLDVTPSSAEASDRALAANFVLLDRPALDVDAQKYPRARWLRGWANARGHFTHRRWRKLYRQYADPASPVPVIDGTMPRYVGSFVTSGAAYLAFKAKARVIRILRDLLDVDRDEAND